MDIGWAGGGGRLELSSGLLGFHFGLRRCWSRWRQHVRHAARNHIDDVPLVLLGPAHCDVIDVLRDAPGQKLFVRRRAGRRAGRPVKVKRTMVVNSVLNSIVERQWFECNDVTENIKQEARTLIRQDLMQAGRNPDRIDQYCFCAAYRADVTHRVDVHYRAMQLRRKEVTTRNPNYPRGTYVPLHRLNEAGDGCSLRVTDEEIAVVDRFVADYYGSTAALAIEPQSPWEVDPLDPAERAACDTLVASMGSMTPMETYVVMRGETHRLVDARL